MQGIELSWWVSLELMCQPTESSDTAQGGTVLQQAVSRSGNGLAMQLMTQLMMQSMMRLSGHKWLPYNLPYCAKGLHQGWSKQRI